MIRLALETSTDFCSAALEVGGEILERRALAPRGHAELLLPWTRELLSEAGLGFADLDALAVSRGPGSFTSLRIGLAVAQGIALARELPIYPVSSLAVLAQAADPDRKAERLLAVLDARMAEIYAGFFSVQQGHRRAIAEEIVIAPAQLQLPQAGSWLAAGPGLVSYRDKFQTPFADHRVEWNPEVWPDARSVLALADSASPIAAWELEPNYIRDQVAG